jgi:Flp pilus assembly secretin CpaC
MKDRTHKRTPPLPLSLFCLLALIWAGRLVAQAQEPAATASPTTEPAQVQLQIRLTEVNRRALRELVTVHNVVSRAVPVQLNVSSPGRRNDEGEFPGAHLATRAAQAPVAINLLTSGAVGLAEAGAFIQTLQTQGALRDLKAPVILTVTEGRGAGFLAGEEFPVPLLQADGQGQSIVTAQVKEFGLRLHFQPVILDETHLRLELEPAVASLDMGAGITVEGLVIPGLRVRGGRVGLELRDGQSFALTGLFDNFEQANLAKIPALAAGPSLSELFKSRGFQRNETELLVLVTVTLTRAPNADQLAKQPTEPSASAPSTSLPAPRLAGLSGHAVEAKRDSLPVDPAARQSPRNSDISVQVEPGGAKLDRKIDKKEN